MGRTHHEVSLSDDVYSQLKDYILGDIERPAERLQIGQLSQHFGVSITPIREALIRLASEALIDLKPGKGFFYREYNPLEQISFYELGFSVLKYSIEKGNARPSIRFLYDLSAVLPSEGDALYAEAAVRANVMAVEKLYEQIANGSGNAQIVSLVRTLCERTRISRLLDLEQPANAAFILGGLKQVVAGLKQGDSEGAIAKLRAQLEAKRGRMRALANERLRRVYEAHPLLRPGFVRR